MAYGFVFFSEEIGADRALAKKVVSFMGKEVEVKRAVHGGFQGDKLPLWHNIVIIGVGRGRPCILRNVGMGRPIILFDELKSITHCNT